MQLGFELFACAAMGHVLRGPSSAASSTALRRARSRVSSLAMRRPRLVLALLASCATLPAAAPSDATSLKAHRFLFMGGLQRSGTTWLEGLVASPLTSALSFENIDPREYERLQPWRLQARPPTRAPAPRVAA